MKKEYRSAVRSRQMIKTAFVELLSAKDIDKITVVDIVNRADLSRNTFYAHYQDVYAIMEEIENDFLIKLDVYMDESIAKNEIDNPLPLLLRIAHFIDKDKEINRILITNKNAAAFLDKLKAVFVERVIDNIDTVAIKDKMGFLVYMEFVASGAIGLYQIYLKDEIDMSLEDISKAINRIFIAGFQLYK